MPLQNFVQLHKTMHFTNNVKNELKQGNNNRDVDLIFEKYNSKNTTLNTIRQHKSI